MNRQFASYEIAKQLKELKFNEPCFGIWINRGEKVDVMYVAKQDDAWMAEQNEGILAPLWQQAINWCLNKLESFNPEPYNRKWSIEYCADKSGAIDFGEGDYYFEFKTLGELVLELVRLINKRV